jgi:hypothetical protein
VKHIPLNFIVQWRVRGETGTLVHFDKPWSELAVDQNVKAQDLKAHGVVKILRLTRPVQVSQVWLTDHHRFHYDILDLLHQQVDICTLLRQDFEDSPQTPFVSFVFSIFVLILFKRIIILINRVIGQMHV